MSTDAGALPPNMQRKIRFELCMASDLDDPTCWTWTGAVSSKCYGSVGYQGRVCSTHRLSYELLVGPILPGLQIDHLCRNKRCCNPAHLEPVTPRVNVQRSHADQASCVNGHEYTPENTIYKKNGTQRNCRACANQWQRDYRAAHKAAS
jgi:hypothetical protein